MAAFYFVALSVVILIAYLLYSKSKCHHEWVRYMLQKTISSPRQKCIICRKCGKTVIHEPGVRTVYEGVIFNEYDIVDVKQEWDRR